MRIIIALCLVFVTVTAEDFDASQWELTFSDEFEGNTLDEKKWNPVDPWGVVRNDELQGYVQNAFIVKDGILKIHCDDSASFYDGAKRNYRSGMMTTTGKFAQKYGRFEIRCKVPKGRGLWPAFWMLPEPPAWPPEIDILEILCQETDTIYLTNHWPDPANPGASKSNTHSFKGPDFSADFHNFAVEWEKGEIRWLIDGIERHRSQTEVPDLPMFLMVNLAVGGWAGKPDEKTVFPADFEVDYVKAWRRKP